MPINIEVVTRRYFHVRCRRRHYRFSPIHYDRRWNFHENTPREVSMPLGRAVWCFIYAADTIFHILPFLQSHREPAAVCRQYWMMPFILHYFTRKDAAIIVFSCIRHIVTAEQSHITYSLAFLPSFSVVEFIIYRQIGRHAANILSFVFLFFIRWWMTKYHVGFLLTFFFSFSPPAAAAALRVGVLHVEYRWFST